MYRWNMVSWEHSRDGGGAPWVKYLNPRTPPKLGVAVHTCSPRTWASWWKQAHPHSRGTHIHKRAKLLKKRSQEHKKLKKYASWAARRFSLLRHLPTTWRPKLIPWNPRERTDSLIVGPLTVAHTCVWERVVLKLLFVFLFVSLCPVSISKPYFLEMKLVDQMTYVLGAILFSGELSGNPHSCKPTAIFNMF